MWQARSGSDFGIAYAMRLLCPHRYASLLAMQPITLRRVHIWPNFRACPAAVRLDMAVALVPWCPPLLGPQVSDRGCRGQCPLRTGNDEFGAAPGRSSQRTCGATVVTRFRVQVLMYVRACSPPTHGDPPSARARLLCVR